ncbi:unnamed protein product [Rotaria magnacalcarata]|uniref:Uncharacterized protein n=1 Tax=Rotaria magnacalcarata TaxID=392030 RepID=A0A816TUZ0_9BILA|nr:unnamed protein product [Rotaria magnacalcarata]CAF2139687.1 unnamed protein product [Rotaria magnacalcarata]CAF3859467.1 unnamed protein product [Rotaria magnacalcarata]CAF4246299.1 unnamed protein product [Rotaria magnacalcarata]
MVYRIPVTIHGMAEKYLILCETGHEAIEWLCETAYDRYSEKYIDKTRPYCYTARRITDRSQLSLKDPVNKVLEDNEPIEIDVAKRSNDDDDSFSTAT